MIFLNQIELIFINIQSVSFLLVSENNAHSSFGGFMSAYLGSLQERYRHLVELSNEGRYKEAIDVGESLYRDLNLLSDDNIENLNVQLANVLQILGLSYRHTTNYHEAEKKFKEALSITQNDLEDQNLPLGVRLNYARGLDGLASVYLDKGNYHEAEKKFKEALSIKRQLLGNDDHETIAYALHNLAEVYRHIGDYNKAEEMYQEALRIARKILPEEHRLIAYIKGNLAEVYRHIGDYNKAEELNREALRMLGGIE
jgi:tetratricopeptide (TPR) repeat protein